MVCIRLVVEATAARVRAFACRLQDYAMESKDGPLDYDDLIWEVLAQ